MFAIFALIFVIFTGPVMADDMRLWRVGGYGYAPAFSTDRSALPSLQRAAYVEPDAGLDLSALRDRLGGGLTMGVMRLRWRGELCVSLRKRFDRCDLLVERDQVMLFLREGTGRMRMKFHFGIRP